MRLILGTLLIALATTLHAPTAVAAGPDEVTVTGSGYGHGKGMSQYGAKERAEAGHTHRQILGFYYPGTAVGSARGSLKVLITADTTSGVVVRHRSALTVRSLKSGRVWNLTKRNARRWRITPLPGNRSSRLWVHTGRWRVVRDIAGQAEFRAGGRPIRLYVPGGSAVYRGSLRSAVPSSGAGRDTVNVVPLEAYLRGVVAREMPASWSPHAVRAQAVAARTYAVHERETTNRGYFDVWDTTRSQVYGGVGSEHPSSNAAIAATRGEIRTYGRRAAFTQFGSSNGGWTVKGGFPYLPARQDRFDPATRWTVRISDDAIERAWPSIGDLESVTVAAGDRDRRGSWGGRVLEVTIKGTKDTATPTGESFRSILGLRSTLFTVS
ncbi:MULTISPECIES: SpoIID/LytB domain-containing protein [Nocardioides]|uniref:SpoIID/LytB domain-containing protein n=1 Tax=Nocardioides vastitatis TaxID=2568655 RepID=A0ABW0Z9T8_9ACTN|nr:SpoIID/LytB domain-containing protein [Nocardioides sp.]THI95943.1 SpoIID/LytB domain-containing protein [Nocardioides sp.]